MNLLVISLLYDEFTRHKEMIHHHKKKKKKKKKKKSMPLQDQVVNAKETSSKSVKNILMSSSQA